MKNLNDFQRGYLAAMLDGEGSIIAALCKPKLGWHDKKQKLRPATVRVAVSFSNSSLEMLKMLNEWTGLGRIVLARNTTYANARPCWHLVIGGQPEMYDLLIEIRHGLIIKRAQADLMIDYLRSRMNRRAGLVWPRINDEELAIIQRVRVLNNTYGKRPGSQTS